MNELFFRVSRRARNYLGPKLGHYLPWLYSTVDNPVAIPVQMAAYQFVSDHFVEPETAILDVGSGLGFGAEILSQKGNPVSGIDIDRKAVRFAKKRLHRARQTVNFRHYNGMHIPFADQSFEIVTCIDVIEHVPDYHAFLKEIIRVSEGRVVLVTPNRRMENTNADGSPKNHWHLREWSYPELNDILLEHPGIETCWFFINGPWEGPFSIADSPGADTQSLMPVIHTRKAGQ